MKDHFWENLRQLKEEHRIGPGASSNDKARKRIVLLVTDCILKSFPNISTIHQIPFIESCLWNSLKGLKLRCDPLPQEGNGNRTNGCLGQEKVYTDNQQWSQSTKSLVYEIIKILSERREEYGVGRDNHRKGTRGAIRYRRQGHVQSQAKRPSLYSARSRKESLFGRRGGGVDKSQPN